jgi:hypothetical protein
MDALIADFTTAQLDGKGYELAQTLTPIAPSKQPDLLHAFYRSTNAAHVERDLQYRLMYDKNSRLRFSKDEATAWVDIFTKYWKAVGEILKAEDISNSGPQVRHYSLLCILLPDYEPLIT